MADRWVSQGRRFCKFCSCWFADNKISLDNHEKGLSHQQNVERELNRTRQNKLDLAAAERAMQQEIQRIEAAALRAFEEDAKVNEFARNEMDRVKAARAKSLGFQANK